jgi:hypothetical protein
MRCEGLMLRFRLMERLIELEKRRGGLDGG